MRFYLGLGSNLENRKNHLEAGLQKLKARLKPLHFKVSPLYETPALLPQDAKSDWNKPFFNLAVELDCEISPQELLRIAQEIEQEFGRSREPRWSPRALDIDILLCEGDTVLTSKLTIPHPEIKNRAFVLDPLKDLNPSLVIPHQGSVLDLSRRHAQHAPLWMAIVNLTPDSFSDGQSFSIAGSVEKELSQLIEHNVGIIDVGGESTRPGATPVREQEEWLRIQPALHILRDKIKNLEICPQISVDTRHFSTAIKAIEAGANIINDVSGLADERFIDILKSSGCQYVLTHSLSLPADPKHVVAENLDIIYELKHWFRHKIDLFLERGVRREQIIIDPGIGFGKTALQSQTLLKNVESFYDMGCRVLIGHSRKSFLSSLVETVPHERDIESVGISLALANKGVDILRVHNPILHMRAFKGWNYIRSNI